MRARSSSGGRASSCTASNTSLKPAALAVLLILCACADRPPEPTCPHDPAFDRSELISVRADVRPTVLRRDLSLEELAAESGGAVGSGKPQGLTEVEGRLSFHTLVNMETVGGRSCVWFDEVNVDLTPASIQIFVPREYGENSCESMAVLEHEREHERAHRAHLAAAVEDVAAALSAARWLPSRGNPLEAGGDRAAAEAALNAKIRKVVTPVYERYRESLKAAQADLDKPALYEWVSKRCSGWK